MIAIIVPTSRSYTPYLAHYEKILNDAGIPYEMYYWDRFHIHEKTIYGETFTCNCPDHGFGSIRGYLAYRRFLLNKLRNKNYSFYIVLSVQMGILLYQFLQDKKFILDIRDFSHENKSLYRSFANRLIKSAVAVVISSDGFRIWLPTGREYLLSHNVSLESFHNVKMFPRFDPDRLVISYIGGVSYYEANLRVINAVSKNDKIHLSYIGSGTCEKELETFCVNNNIENVTFSGRFSPSQKGNFYNDTDFVLSCYGDDTPVVRTALPNRLYESCFYKRPLIVNTGTYLSDLVRNYNIGVVVDLNNTDHLYNKLIEMTEHKNYQNYVKNCDIFIEAVRNDIRIFNITISNLISSVLLSARC
jgi:glycosyltransferase involved in cell wall biosynthesis